MRLSSAEMEAAPRAIFSLALSPKVERLFHRVSDFMLKERGHAPSMGTMKLAAIWMIYSKFRFFMDRIAAKEERSPAMTFDSIMAANLEELAAMVEIGELSFARFMLIFSVFLDGVISHTPYFNSNTGDLCFDPAKAP